MTVEVNLDNFPNPPALKFRGARVEDLPDDELQFLARSGKGLSYKSRAAILDELDRRLPRRQRREPRKPLFVRRGFFNAD